LRLQAVVACLHVGVRAGCLFDGLDDGFGLARVLLLRVERARILRDDREDDDSRVGRNLRVRLAHDHDARTHALFLL
jgi:hypothetical protein